MSVVSPLLTVRGMARRQLSITIGSSLVALVALTALVSFVWTPSDPHAIDSDHTLLGPGASGHLLGTDRFGRDVLSQLMVGARLTLLIGMVAVVIAAVIGIPLGLVAGLRAKSWVSELILRSIDVLFGFPALLLAILLAASYGASITTAMIAIGVATIPSFVRITYAGSLQVMALDYITAARASGLRSVALARRHVIPNIASLLLVQASVAFALSILAEAGLSYLSLSSDPSTPSWGRMLRDSQTFLYSAPTLAIWPGLAIALSVLGFNLLGDGLRDRFDPKQRQR